LSLLKVVLSLTAIGMLAADAGNHGVSILPGALPGAATARGCAQTDPRPAAPALAAR
jgi:hypothetical protein